MLSGNSPDQDGGQNFGFENLLKEIRVKREFFFAILRIKKTTLFLTRTKYRGTFACVDSVPPPFRRSLARLREQFAILSNCTTVT